MTESEEARSVASIKRDRAGRPAGATNLVKREMLDFIRKTLGDPMLESARMAMHTAESLAIELGCSKFEAAQFIERIRTDLRPYFYAKQAPVDDAGNAMVPRFTMVLGGHSAAAIGPGGPEMPPWLYLEHVPNDNAESQQNQGLLEPASGVSHGDVSHGDDK